MICKSFTFLFLGLALVGCSKATIQVDRYVVLPSDMPSVYIDSPDPKKENPSFGQVLNVRYRIKKLDNNSWPYMVLLKVIYKNLEEESFSYSIGHLEGSFEFLVLDEKYENTGGILTYKAEIFSFDGEEIAQFKHKLWFDLITFPY